MTKKLVHLYDFFKLPSGNTVQILGFSETKKIKMVSVCYVGARRSEESFTLSLQFVIQYGVKTDARGA